MLKKRLDVLSRGEFIDSAINIIKHSFKFENIQSIAIDGEWGSGKSFVISEIEEELKKENYIVINFNSWETNYYNEPLIPILLSLKNSIYAVDSIIQMNDEAKNMFNGLIYGLNSFAINKIGFDYTNITKDDRNEQNRDFIEIQSLIEKFKLNFAKITENKKVAIFIDELDRCLPDYSIKVLERIHTLFYSVQNTLIVYSIDKEKLNHSIKQIFGDVDCNGYLRKFISFTIQLDYGTPDSNIFEKYSDYFELFEDDLHYQYKDLLMVLLKEIDIRTQEKIFNKLYLIHNLSHSEETGEKCRLALLYFETLSELFRYLIKKNSTEPNAGPKHILRYWENFVNNINIDKDVDGFNSDFIPTKKFECEMKLFLHLANSLISEDIPLPYENESYNDFQNRECDEIKKVAFFAGIFTTYSKIIKL